MSEAYEFLVSKKRFWIMCLSSALAALLLYGAGFATGLWLYPRTELAKRTVPSPAPDLPKLPAIEVATAKPATAKGGGDAPPAAGAPEAAPKPTSAKPSTAAPADATATPPGDSKTESQTAKAAAPASAPAAPPVPDTSGLQLTVQAGSFAEKGNAERLAKLLRQNGYDATLLDRTDGGDHTWHLVRLGPYRSWEDASKVASDLLARHDVNAIIRPVRFN